MRKTLIFLCLMILCAPVCAQNPKAGLKQFVRYGTNDKRIEVSGDEVLAALIEGRDIEIDFAVINGDLRAKDIIEKLNKDPENRGIIDVNIKISHSEIYGYVDFDSAIFNKPVNFEFTKFVEDVSFVSSKFGEIIYFKDAIFRKNADFSFVTFSESANFSSVIFDGVAYFMFSKFIENTPANFGSATFGEGAFFIFTKFDGSAYFKDAKFNETANFLRSVFSKNVDFGSTLFSDFADFRFTKFSEITNFRTAIFNEATDFHSAIFDKPVYFVSVTFNGSASFSFAAFNDSADFSSAVFGGVSSFSFVSFLKTIRFYDVKMEYPADFSKVIFYKNTVFKGLWNTTLGRIDSLQPKVTEFDGFNTNVVMDTASNPGLKRYIDDEIWIKSWRQQGITWQEKAWYEFWFVLWELTSHCGRSIGLWAIWSALLAVMFGLLLNGHIQIDSVNNWYTPFYFSVVTFTTLGFGDVKPSDWIGQLLITIEVISGYVMLGGLISIFANSLARRS